MILSLLYLMYILGNFTVVSSCDVSRTRFNLNAQETQHDQRKKNVLLQIGLAANTSHLDLLLSRDSVHLQKKLFFRTCSTSSKVTPLSVTDSTAASQSYKRLKYTELQNKQEERICGFTSGFFTAYQRALCKSERKSRHDSPNASRGQ